MSKRVALNKKPRRAKPATSPRRPAAKAALPPPAQPATADWVKRRDQRKAEQAAMIAADPREALQSMQDRLDYALEVLFDLIDKRTLFYQMRTADGAEDFSHDEAAQSLCTRYAWLTRQMIKYAHAGNPECVTAVWESAKLLVDALHDLALDKRTARELQRYARHSLFLPSLRALSGVFTYDFPAVADALHLSEDCLVHMARAAGHKLDSPVTRLIAEVVEAIGWEQARVRQGREHYARLRTLHADRKFMARLPKGDAAYAKRVDAMTADEYLVRCYGCRPDALPFAELPPLTKATADEWWSKAVRPEATRRFATLTGTRLYGILRGNKPHEKLDDLRRRGKVSLRSLARPTPQDPHPS